MGVSTAQAKRSKIEADWDQKSLSAAIEAAREVVSKEGVNSRAMISSLSELEWGWICAAAVFAWIKTKAKQAVEEGTSYNLPIRTMKSRDPEPWEAGAIETILPALGEMDLPWSLPLSEWPKESITAFSWQIYRLANAALAARDEGAGDKITRRLSQAEVEREMSAAHGGSLMSSAELNDAVPF